MAHWMNKKRFFRPGWLIIFVILLYFIGKSILFDKSFSFNETVVFDKWASIATVYEKLTPAQTRSTRWYLYNNKDALEAIQQGSYVFSGTYTPETLVAQLNKWPTRSYEVVTILEWWSIYDIDAYLVKQWYITEGEYITYVSNPSNISSISNKYPFVQKFLDTKPSTAPAQVSLEWLLYPDTYHINANQPILDQLVSLQLKAFQDKVYGPYQSQIESFSTRLSSQWFTFSLGRYNIVTLASIIEKEERNVTNKPIIAGIFLNRIQSGMRIDADITLCYWLKTGYEVCTPSLIVKSISDANNIYNTRVHNWLTPTPIANPSASTFKSLLDFVKTNNMYYLHGSDGKIYYGTTLQEHNSNKQYL